MTKKENIVKGVTDHQKKLPSGSMPILKEKKKLPEPRGRVVRKESVEKKVYVPVGKVVRNKTKP
jgi:hypothetical protein